MLQTLATVFILAAALCSSALFAQPPDTLWTRYLGGDGDDYADGIIATSDGGFVVSGSSISFGSSLDFYLAKLSADGEPLWQRSFGDSVRYETCAALSPTRDGGFLLGGYSLLFLPFRTDGYILKCDGEGFPVQTRLISYADSQLSIFACGELDNGYWIAGVASISEFTRGFLLFLNPDFSVREHHYYSRNNLAGFRCGAQLADGGFLLAGETFFSETEPADAWVVRTDSQGNELWNRTFGGNEDELIGSAFAVEAGGFVIGGLTTSFENPQGNFYALRLSENGDSLWQRLYGEASEENHGHELLPTTDGGFLFAGHRSVNDGGAAQISIYKLDADGNEQWNLLQGSGDTEVAEGLVETSDYGFAVCANSFPDQGDSQLWVLRCEPTSAITPPRATPQNLALLQCYPNPFNNQTTVRFALARGGKARLSLYDLQGRLVRVLQNGYVAHGEQRYRFDAAGLATGMYFCRLQGEIDISIPIVIIR